MFELKIKKLQLLVVLAQEKPNSAGDVIKKNLKYKLRYIYLKQKGRYYIFI